MALPGPAPFSMAPPPQTSTPAAAPHSPEDSSKRIRKPYTISKSRESWTDAEHDKFFEALHLFDRDWKKIEAFVGSKTVIQIRSHAQKYFLKVQRNGTNEHVPPPRPKRKAAHPYPQKAPKNAQLPSQVRGSVQSSSARHGTGHVLRAHTSSIPRRPVVSAAASALTEKSAPKIRSLHVLKDDLKSTEPIVTNNYCSSTESTPGTQTGGVAGRGNQGHSLRGKHVLPDFSQVYSFIGSVFDPNVTDHLQKLKQMDPIDVETSVMLMRNLSINLTSPAFEDHRRLLSSSYEIDSEDSSQWRI